MFDSLQEKRVLITGAATGIGAAIADLFGSYRAKVGIHYYQSQEKARSVAQRVRRCSGWARTYQADLAESDRAARLVEGFVEDCGGIDVLVNNAGGIFDYVHFSTLRDAAWDNTFALNVKAPFFLITKAFAYMKPRRYGRVINISTISAKYGGSAYNLHYSASKAALDALTRGFAREGAKFNILVNSVRCGVIDSGMGEKIPGYRRERFQQRISLVPLKRAGTPEEVARMVVFLASEGGDFVTGQTIPVSGGD